VLRDVVGYDAATIAAHKQDGVGIVEVGVMEDSWMMHSGESRL
jgi:hypothetical protein